jgi:hypothetical protein
MSFANPRGRMSMVANRLHELRTLEGRRVSVALRSGVRLHDCRLVSAPRGGVRTVWVVVNGADAFVPVDDLVDLSEAA